ncbi:lipid II:glycine glycyltransferase FemX [Treponema socranskii]|uniref:lipid II:glycine glycyltransferase FemX n=1 Tax=Treponema socranskii TaxID=53419 RepID=UPI003D6FC856
MHIEITDKWNDKLDQFSDNKKDIYFSESYVKLASEKNEIPLCVVCEDDGNLMLFPFLRSSYKSYFDFETPYGYGGPISNYKNSVWNENALKNIMTYFSSQNYIAGFVRFHPLLDNADFCRNIFTVIDDRKTIAIDTSVTEGEIWMNQVSSKNRNMIRKAEKNRLTFERDNDFKYIEEFKRLYRYTMSRLDADEFYFFNDEYYKNFIEIFKGKGFLGCIKKDDEIISAALFMYENDWGHYHLAGSNREYSSLGANNLLLWKVACEMHKEGVKEFHLGGGTNEDEENSLFKFKHSFSPNTKQFSIGKMIFNKEVYESVCAEWTNDNPEKAEKYKNHLLKYRY